MESHVNVLATTAFKTHVSFLKRISSIVFLKRFPTIGSTIQFTIVNAAAINCHDMDAWPNVMGDEGRSNLLEIFA